MTSRSLKGVLLVSVVAGGLSVLPNKSDAFVDGPPPAVTGGFKEETCRMCHYDYGLNDPAGSLRLEGIPEKYAAGERYTINVRLSHPQLERGGFEIAARFADGNRAGEQAGAFETLDGRTALVKGTNPAIQYARQTRSGSAPETKGSIQWSIQWRAPEDAAGPVVFHAAANAANYDDSPLGDFPYALEMTSKFEGR
jgi:hypothetical protein